MTAITNFSRTSYSLTEYVILLIKCGKESRAKRKDYDNAGDPRDKNRCRTRQFFRKAQARQSRTRISFSLRVTRDHGIIFASERRLHVAF